MTTKVGDVVHYVSYGTPGGEFPSVCRAAHVTELGDGNRLGLCVINPMGLFFHPLAAGGCEYHDGAEQPGSLDCPDRAGHGNPFRYCACGWREASRRGGTWHQVNECEQYGAGAR